MLQMAKYVGVTAPLSIAEPTQLDLDLSKKLEESMKPYGVFEGPEELAKRLGNYFYATYWQRIVQF